MSARWRRIFLLIGIAGIVVIIRKLNPSQELWSELFSINIFGLLLKIFGLWMLIYCVHTISYCIILGKEKKNISFFAILKMYMSGYALNCVTPAGMFGGEPYRIMELRRNLRPEVAASSSVLFNLCYAVGHLTLWASTGALYFALKIKGDGFLSFVFGAVLIVCVIALIVIFGSRKKGFVYGSFKLLGRLPLIKGIFRKLLEKNGQHYHDIDNNIIAFRRKNLFWLVILIEYFSRVIEAYEYTMILNYFGVEVSFVNTILVYGIASIIANLLFFIPMQAGAREGGLLIAISLIGINTEFVPVVSLVYRLREIIFIIIGVILVGITKRIRIVRVFGKKGRLSPLEPRIVMGKSLCQAFKVVDFVLFLISVASYIILPMVVKTGSAFEQSVIYDIISIAVVVLFFFTVILFIGRLVNAIQYSVEVHNTYLIERKGMFSVKETCTEYVSVKSVDIDKPFFGKILGFGDISVTFSDGKVLTFTNVKRPERAREVFESLISKIPPITFDRTK